MRRNHSCAPLGELARRGIDAYRGMALTCLCAADRHHRLDTEIQPALREGRVVLCDRYVASSLVLQGLDGLSRRGGVAAQPWRLRPGPVGHPHRRRGRDRLPAARTRCSSCNSDAGWSPRWTSPPTRCTTSQLSSY
ncbi:hypothetical protein AB0K14_26500 [Actinosynnema sp. NPDC050801]|uniref:dTMP kinase n=1 Tax=unclassified Actinosynnema TaxID=2637065 RepID=UPI0033C6911D